ncbi:MAG: transcriptional regulator [Candidatus Pacebacteria bacterium CG10_big_fil_rev_8_21_14_0_10_44_54]|nr:MAG: transcriptional regulator [Candidatus Pacebacteria bacterium CG10_big_fil_rev_8_21_14_0_10_44_54]
MDKESVQIGFGKRLRKLREEQNLTQEELAYKAELHFTYIGQAERGLRNLTLHSIAKIAKALRVKGGDLLPF